MRAYLTDDGWPKSQQMINRLFNELQHRRLIIGSVSANSAVVVLAGCTICGIGYAQEIDTIVTDRPSFSASPLTVAKGRWQTEFGYLFTRIDSDNSSQTLPNALLRLGLSDDAELQISWSGYTRLESGFGSSSGYSDVSIGGKWQLSEDDARTRFAFLASISIPVGDNAFSSDSYDPNIRLIWSHSGALEWFGTASLSKSDGNNSFSNGLGLSFALGKESSLFVEHVVTLPEQGSISQELNSGLAILRGANTQFDIHGTVGLNSSASDFALGVGYSRRF